MQNEGDQVNPPGNDGKIAAKKALFSLEVSLSEVYMNTSVLQSIIDEEENEPIDLVVGFQFLNFEIVPLAIVCTNVFENFNEKQSKAQVKTAKSCLFELSVDEIRSNAFRKPLCLLLLKKSPTKQRKNRTQVVSFLSCKFPSCPYDLSKISQWSCQEVSQEFHNHCGDEIGKMNFAIILSCLGGSIAPHIQQALTKSRLLIKSSDCPKLPSTDSINCNIEFKEVAVRKKTKITCEIGIQCDHSVLLDFCNQPSKKDTTIGSSQLDQTTSSGDEDFPFFKRRDPPPLFYSNVCKK